MAKRERPARERRFKTAPRFQEWGVRTSDDLEVPAPNALKHLNVSSGGLDQVEWLARTHERREDLSIFVTAPQADERPGGTKSRIRNEALPLRRAPLAAHERDPMQAPFSPAGDPTSLSSSDTAGVRRS
jgi:hypothetical protein